MNKHGVDVDKIQVGDGVVCDSQIPWLVVELPGGSFCFPGDFRCQDPSDELFGLVGPDDIEKHIPKNPAQRSNTLPAFICDENHGAPVVLAMCDMTDVQEHVLSVLEESEIKDVYIWHGECKYRVKLDGRSVTLGYNGDELVGATSTSHQEPVRPSQDVGPGKKPAKSLLHNISVMIDHPDVNGYKVERDDGRITIRVY